MRSRTAFLLLVGVLSSACSSITVSTDYDHEANFAAYHTYAWAEPTGQQARGFWDGRIRRAVEKQLEAKGLTKATGAPDLGVAYAAGLDKQVRVDTTGYGGYGWRWGGGMSTSTVTEVPVGTLVVDLLDVAKKELVWRGKASGTLSHPDDPEAGEQGLNDAIADMFEGYPPKKK
jgi:uncharacterized protein DUF4136